MKVGASYTLISYSQTRNTRTTAGDAMPPSQNASPTCSRLMQAYPLARLAVVMALQGLDCCLTRL